MANLVVKDINEAASPDRRLS